ncbi:hypothetical protein Pth03_80710 [Planotetraspora thailandica]|uniref:Uncharacterized protein n=1 Tax=Planotetraspora thailandica TaxID=487172 RepID=A0A8J3Y2U5_9ACTN|nr:hypothetical protein Pth03_80710 [Planotetraspora thailandica]
MSTARRSPGPNVAGDVAAAFQPVRHAGQRGGAGAHGHAQFGRRPPAAVGQGVDLGGGQIQVDEFRGERLQSGVGGPLQGEQRRPLEWHRFGFRDIEFADIAVPSVKPSYLILRQPVAARRRSAVPATNMRPTTSQ